MQRYEGGRRVRRYILPSHARNEALDCYCYALAGLLILGEQVRERLPLLVAELRPQESGRATDAATTSRVAAPSAREGFVPRKPNWMSNY